MTESKVAWFHCFSGVAGDMAMGALIDAGADLDEVRALCERLPFDGWALDAEAVKRCGLAGTKIHVRYDESGTVVRTASNILGLIDDAKLPKRVHERAIKTVMALAVAEGRLHGHRPEMVHFHEVGSVDAIIDIVGTCAALEVLDIEEVHCSAIAQGTGLIHAAHGLLPNPAPAVVELLAGAPTFGTSIPFEMTTPTGAALMAAMAVTWGPMPAMQITASGFGAGSRDIDGQPNLTQVVLGSRLAAAETGQPLCKLETNVDDVTGEVLAATIAELLDAGANDAWLTPITMKKGRPAFTVHALADPALVRSLAGVIERETGSLGVRATEYQRWPAARLDAAVDVDGQPVRVKVSAGRVKVEHDDAAAAAKVLGLPIREVLSRSEEAWRHRSSGEEVPSPIPLDGYTRLDHLRGHSHDHHHSPDHHHPHGDDHGHDDDDPTPDGPEAA